MEMAFWGLFGDRLLLVQLLFGEEDNQGFFMVELLRKWLEKKSKYGSVLNGSRWV